VDVNLIISKRKQTSYHKEL